MSIIDTLITDRTAADTAALEALFAKAKAGSLTEEERAILADPAHKGVYNHTDLNRVGAAMEYLRARLEGHGYAVKGYDRLKVPHTGATGLPEGYTQVEYIESSGTQYIDTEYSNSKGFRTVVDFELTSVDDVFKTIVGSHNLSAPYSRNLVGIQDGYFFVGVDEPYAVSTAVTSGVRYNVNFSSIYPNVYCDVNGVNAWSKSLSSPALSALNVLIGADQYSLANGGSLPSMKLYGCQIYDNDTLVRDYLPCISSDGAYGLYDKVNSKFYGNAGSGVFTGGPELKEESKDPYLWYESDIPAPAEMTRYLQNVSAIRAVLAAMPTTPSVPADMEALTAAEANAIEVILMDVETLINNMIAAWLFCGDVYSGEV